jgi:hypothetical protein
MQYMNNTRSVYNRSEMLVPWFQAKCKPHLAVRKINCGFRFNFYGMSMNNFFMFCSVFLANFLQK